eukprot:Selendium_serpulae@DN2939_c0_g1_i1.p1
MCCDTKKDWGVVLCCLPLAFATVLVSLAVIWLGSWDIGLAVSTVFFPSWSTILTVIVGCLKILAGLFGIIGLLIKSYKLVRWLPLGWQLVFISVAVQFVIQWTVWILDLTGVSRSPAWDPTSEEIVWMSVFTVSCIVLFILNYWINCTLASVAEIIKVGGSGWERLSYEEINEVKDVEAMAGDDASEVDVGDRDIEVGDRDQDSD